MVLPVSCLFGPSPLWARFLAVNRISLYQIAAGETEFAGRPFDENDISGAVRIGYSSGSEHRFRALISGFLVTRAVQRSTSRADDSKSRYRFDIWWKRPSSIDFAKPKNAISNS